MNTTDRERDGARIRVSTQPAPVRDYDVVISAGVLHKASSLIMDAVPTTHYGIIAPESIAAQYAAPLQQALGERASLFTFPAGEAQKSRATWGTLTDAMLAQGFGRDTCVIAVGGGVTGDLAGFVAATYMRGVPVVHVPTTLLGMIDASVGGKTGVDTPAGKNLVGAFHPPGLVLIDPTVLQTLPPAELRSGLAEAVKHGAILDEKYLARITGEADALLAADVDALQWLITRSVELKARIVARDPHERGIRAILNFGHTVAHAIEAHSNYAMPHGFAVAAGMVAEAALGEAIGITHAGSARRLRDLLRRLELPTGVPDDTEQLLDFMRIDKKARAAVPRFALLRYVGAAAPGAEGEWTHEVPVGVVAAVLKSVSLGSDIV